PAGQALFGAMFHTDRFINGVALLECRSVMSGDLSSTASTSAQSPGNTGFLSVQECSNGGFVDGAFVRTGDRLDGIALHCDRHNLPDTKFKLSVTRSGFGVVQSGGAAGINCGTSCDGEFRVGTTVGLKPQAMPGWVFAGWGGACNGTGGCSLA